MPNLTAKPRIGRDPRMNGTEMLLIARLSSQGRSSKTIARMLSTEERSITAETVAEWLRRARQPAEDLHMALAAHRIDAVEAWGLALKRGARDGRHAPSKDLLIATGTIRSDATDRLVVVIGNGQPDASTLPALPPRTIDALPAKPEP